MSVDGVLVIDKPAGVVSMRVVEQVRRLTKTRRAGHTGTLDPMATGVLPICLGQATRIASLLLGEDKEYTATVRLGLETETYDLDGAVVRTGEVPESLTAAEIQEHLTAFTGTITQRPPPFSAVRVGGERLYKKARRGEAVEAPERQVVVHELALESWARPDARLRVRCGTGTYVRSLAADLGARIGCGACLAALRRTRVGALSEQRALSLEAIAERAAAGTLTEVLLTPAEALAHLPAVTLDADEQRRIRDGQAVDAPHPTSATFVRLLDGDGRLLALAEPAKGRLQPRKVFK